MKQLLIAIVMVLALSMNAGATAQKHRHTPRTEQVDTTKNANDAVEAFSDTTTVAESADVDDEDYTRRDAEDVREILEGVGSIMAPGMVIAIIALVVIFLLAPLLIIIAVFYFVNKNRKERYKLAQMAIQNGQPIPDDILNQKQETWDHNDYQAGIRQMFLGVGLAIFLGIVAGLTGFGIGALVFFIGLGKWFIARNAMNNNTRGNDEILNNNDNPSNV